MLSRVPKSALERNAPLPPPFTPLVSVELVAHRCRMDEAAARTDLVPPLPSLLPLPEEGVKRADVLALKLRLAALLSPGEGQRYWTALVGFMQGKINREELGAQIKATLGVQGEAGQYSSLACLAAAGVHDHFL